VAQRDPTLARRRSPWAAPLLTTVIAVAVGLRVWRLGWGLERQLAFPDEILRWSLHVRSFVPLSWDSFALPEALTESDRVFIGGMVYPTLYPYLAGLGTALAVAVGLIPPPVKPVYLEGILVARVVSALASVLAVGVVGALGVRMYGRRAGLLAMAFMAVVPAEVVQAHYASVDVVLMLACAATLLAAHALATRGGVGAALLAGAASGLAFTSKYPGGVMVVPVAWAVLEHALRERAWSRVVSLGLAAAAAFAGAVVLTCPPCVLHSDLMFESINRMRLLDFVSTPAYPDRWYGRRYLYQLVAVLPYGLGWPLALLAVSGVGVALWRRDLADRLVLVCVLPYFLWLGSLATHVTQMRYLLPLVPGVVVLAARAGTTVMRGRVGVLVLLAVWLYSFALTTSQVRRFSYDQQFEVAAWLEAEGHRQVGVPAFLKIYYRLCTPLQQMGVQCVAISDAAWSAPSPDVIVLPDVYAAMVARRQRGTAVASAVASLQAGTLGYREVRHWPSWFVQRSLYDCIDPMLAANMVPGEMGFRVFVRETPSGADP
jgi:hypothetical protein